MCKECGVLYANPRMTEETYAQFYANEYRQIYDRPDETADEQSERGEKAAQALQDYLTEKHQCKPAVVFDIGCNAGGWLKPFQDAGAEVHGVDYGPERVAIGQAQGRNIEVGSIETLEVMGKQADLIIMNHVLEHATNIESTLLRVRGLLKADGMLYVALPGLYMADLDTVFQNAHPWQFTAETLAYVMECCGFEEVRADHTIVSLWKKSAVFRDKNDKPTRFLRDIANRLYRRGTRFVPHVRTCNKFSKADRQASVASATSRGLPEIAELIDAHVGRSAVIIGGGPSVDAEVETIRALQDTGSIVFSIERMYPWCLSHGLIPDYVVTQDASDDVQEAFTQLQAGSAHLVATQCQPATFDALQDERVYFFHTNADLTIEELAGPELEGVLVNSGGSVTLCSLSLAMLLGCAHLHVFGFDCHVTGGTYAKGIAGVGEQADLIHIKIDGRAFRTTPAYLAFAQQFFELKSIGERDGLWRTVKVYGDSLVTAMSRENIGA